MSLKLSLVLFLLLLPALPVLASQKRVLVNPPVAAT